MNNILERLRSGSQDVQQDAAIDISTFNPDRTINRNVAEQATPLLKELLQNGTSEKQGTAASALARVARDHQDLVQGVEDSLVSLLRDDTIYQYHYYNATQAIRALASLEADSCVNEIDRATDWYREENEHRPWAAGVLTVHYLRPDETDAVDYRHVNFVCAEGVTLLAKIRLDDSVDDSTVAAILLDDVVNDNGQGELRDILLLAGQDDPERLEDAVPYLEQNIQNRQHQSAEYALQVLRKYADIRPEELTHLIDEVAKYLDHEQGYNDPRSATGFLADLVSIARDQVADHRKRIEELRDHSEGHTQQHCSTIIETLDETHNTSDPNIKQRDAENSERDTANGSDTASDNGADDIGASEPRDTSDGESPRTKRSTDNTADAESGSTIIETPRDQESQHPNPDLTEDDDSFVTTRRRERDPAIAQRIRDAYDERCAVCGVRRVAPNGNTEVEAAHIYPKSEGGVDDVRNGVALCKLHHWAFDNGWLSITDDYEIIVCDAQDCDGYEEFSELDENTLYLPDNAGLRPHSKFLREHRSLHGFKE